jgi:hypothetical protein
MRRREQDAGHRTADPASRGDPWLRRGGKGFRRRVERHTSGYDSKARERSSIGRRSGTRNDWNNPIVAEKQGAHPSDANGV